MRSLLLLFGLTLVLTGCESSDAPVKVPPGATFEVFTIKAANGPNTTQAVDPKTGDQLFLQSPPILTTTDIDTVANDVMDIENADGTLSRLHQLALKVELTPEDAAKMATATATPTGKAIAVVINGKVISTPRMNSQVHGLFQISGASDNQHFTSAIKALTKR
jgi:preprotein translocase subunit SecD